MEIKLKRLTLENFKGVDLSGRRFNRLTVIGLAGKDSHRNIHWHCQCDCGNKTITQRGALINATTKSCGCKHNEDNKTRAITHGMSTTRTFRAWTGMTARCKYDYFPDYYDRGIKICERWSKFENFLEDMREAPVGMSLDRIDTNGNYEPSNCRWASRMTQTQNRRAKGYTFDKKRGKWIAQIKRNFKHYFLGSFDTPEKAKDAYWKARNRFEMEVASGN